MSEKLERWESMFISGHSWNQWVTNTLNALVDREQAREVRDELEARMKEPMIPLDKLLADDDEPLTPPIETGGMDGIKERLERVVERFTLVTIPLGRVGAAFDVGETVRSALLRIEQLEQALNGGAGKQIAALEKELARLQVKFRETTHRMSDGRWTCPHCESLNGAGIAYCEGDLLDDEDGGDTRHARVWAPAAEAFGRTEQAQRPVVSEGAVSWLRKVATLRAAGMLANDYAGEWLRMAGREP